MSDIPAGLRYTTEHEYLRESDEPNVYYVGITDYAQGELGDVVYVELPEPGDSFAPMETFGTIEAVKAVSDLYCPWPARSSASMRRWRRSRTRQYGPLRRGMDDPAAPRRPRGSG